MESPTTQLAVDRTRLAYERTLMAWIRTSASLISLGFSIYKFFQGLRGIGANTGRDGVLGSRHFALLMIATGLLALTTATVDHQRNLRELQGRYGVKSRSLAMLTAALVSVLGIVGFIAV